MVLNFSLGFTKFRCPTCSQAGGEAYEEDKNKLLRNKGVSFPLYIPVVVLVNEWPATTDLIQRPFQIHFCALEILLSDKC